MNEWIDSDSLVPAGNYYDYNATTIDEHSVNVDYRDGIWTNRMNDGIYDWDYIIYRENYGTGILLSNLGGDKEY
jgi:hypothetical protein